VAGWAWDWIEYAPLGFLGYAAAAAHGWSRLGRQPAAFAAYLALLQASRAALLASTHHLQVPAASTAAAAVGLWAAAPAAPALLY